MPARRPTQHRDQRRLGELGDLADGHDASIVELASGDRADAPEPFHRERVEERQLAIGWHDQQPIGLGDATGDLGEELGACHTDGDREPDPFEDVAPQPHRDLGRCARHSSQPADIEERLVDRQPFDQRCRVVEHREHGLARLGVGRHPGVDDDRLRAQTARLRPTHRASDAVRLGLVAGRQHDAGADDHRPAAQARVVALLDRRVERVEIGVQDRRVDRARTYVRTRRRHSQVGPGSISTRSRPSRFAAYMAASARLIASSRSTSIDRIWVTPKLAVVEIASPS